MFVLSFGQESPSDIDETKTVGHDLADVEIDCDTTRDINRENLELAEQFGTELHRHGGNVWFFDDFPAAGPAIAELPSVDKDMVLWAVQRRSVVVKNITYYIYCRNMVSSATGSTS
ncbi:hypothetical protein E4U19_001487 [Claviceps sp. Clav32 group G5]|nr:hypothetical protein E4U40_002155 [Claviceps sp. LM458 group G5]KAG6028473.1 hypothetical protein E4U19_001487 [Claviceps sp. Clav32 group G5]KAG6048076.1 hypothetical protein E4U39_007785 [Claviceps sp. Clav50 group G5]